ncbi:sigma factor-like helix-turn-helix DNA-binding protein, partial [Bacteroidota bacterium]
MEEKIVATELEYRISEIVSDLPEQCRKIYTLSRVNGKKNLDIAKELNISIRTVETQISKALKLLRSNLQDFLKY